jgi:hypothetical protein
MPVFGSFGNEPPQLLQKGGPVKRYDVEINGVKTTLQLTDADAEARGLKKPAAAVESKAAAPAANKARQPANKAKAVKGDA